MSRPPGRVVPYWIAAGDGLAAVINFKRYGASLVNPADSRTIGDLDLPLP